ncbi:MAG TPA: hypothetical protein VNJ01_13915 [Bacteriovoracaceae bacterium]|nr:hypothetical protein [Bacteriovoracaceae bacterium]
MWKKLYSGLAVSLISLNALALPILAESEDGTGLLATIYPDHEDSSKFYFFPNSGALEKGPNGEPRFGMRYWTPKTENSSAGYFSGIFRLYLQGDLGQAVENYKKAGKKIAVIPVQESHLYFMRDEVGNPVITDLYKQVSLPRFSGRAEDSIGISGTLTVDGADAMASILLAGGNAADLKYCYEIKGVSPVFHAQIHLNYKKVYEHFKAQAGGGRHWWKWSIRTEIQKLVEDGTIKIEINGGTANQYDYVMALADRMVLKFMDPVLDNRQASTSGRYSVGYSKTVEDRELSFDLKQREIISREYCVSLGLGELKKFPWLISKRD